ncbi:hypothetical protein ALP52_200074 [Pseudomonas amygdali pv. mori]|uniref:Uncharacterized protein n=1 Tax=Pseudomonas amygdali pv. mori TaxID=34065 RepID=A0A3M5JUY3_PSEA0|nr:hypothetical protein ALP52_200074 [Pseudomonas amygdali pv. mori]
MLRVDQQRVESSYLVDDAYHEAEPTGLVDSRIKPAFAGFMALYRA